MASLSTFRISSIDILSYFPCICNPSCINSMSDFKFHWRVWKSFGAMLSRGMFFFFFVFLNEIPDMYIWSVTAWEKDLMLMHLHVVQNNSICKKIKIKGRKKKIKDYSNLTSHIHDSISSLALVVLMEKRGFTWLSGTVHIVQGESCLQGPKMKSHKHFEMVTRLFTYHRIPPGLISVKSRKGLLLERYCLLTVSLGT